MAWYSFVTDNPITRTASRVTNYVADKAEDVVRAVTPDVVEEFVEDRVEDVQEFVDDRIEDVQELAEDAQEWVGDRVEDVQELAEDAEQWVTTTVDDIGDNLEQAWDDTVAWTEQASFDTLSFMLGGDDDAREYIRDMQAQYSMAWEQLQNGEIGNAFGSVVDAQFLAAHHMYFDPDNDTWLSIAGNYVADAGSVLEEDGIGTFSRIFFWEGLIKGSIGETISGVVDLPDTIGDLTGWYNLYDGSVGDDVSGTIWYSWTGGRYEPETENQAKLLGIGTGVGDVASLFLTFGGAAAPKIAGWAGRAGKFANAADTAADAVRVTSRTRQIMTAALRTGDVITTGVTAPLSVSAEMARYNERELMEVLDTQLKEFGIDQDVIDAADSAEERYNLYVDTVKDKLVEFGEDRAELDEMEPAQIEDLFNEYFLLEDAINNPDAPAPEVPADRRINENAAEEPQEEANAGPSTGVDTDIASSTPPSLSLAGSDFDSPLALEGAFAMAGTEAATAQAEQEEVLAYIGPRYTPGGVAA